MEQHFWSSALVKNVFLKITFRTIIQSAEGYSSKMMESSSCFDQNLCCNSIQLKLYISRIRISKIFPQIFPNLLNLNLNLFLCMNSQSFPLHEFIFSLTVRINTFSRQSFLKIACWQVHHELLLCITNSTLISNSSQCLNWENNLHYGHSPRGEFEKWEEGISHARHTCRGAVFSLSAFIGDIWFLKVDNKFSNSFLFPSLCSILKLQLKLKRLEQIKINPSQVLMSDQTRYSLSFAFHSCPVSSWPLSFAHKYKPHTLQQII